MSRLVTANGGLRCSWWGSCGQMEEEQLSDESVAMEVCREARGEMILSSECFSPTKYCRVEGKPDVNPPFAGLHP